MTLSSKLGQSYEKVKSDVKVKTISVDLGEVKFDLKVRVPLKKEMEDITNRIISPDPARVQKIYERLAQPLRAALNEGGEEFVKALNEKKETIIVKDDDLVIDGTSVRQVANFSAVEEVKVEEYFHLLISETGEPVNENYEQITQEFPEFAIKEIVQAIESAIKPDYKTVKKN